MLGPGGSNIAAVDFGTSKPLRCQWVVEALLFSHTLARSCVLRSTGVLQKGSHVAGND